MANDFARDIQRVIDHEGGATITDNKWDPGGLTKYGIAQRAHPDVDIRALTLEGAVRIYSRDYRLKTPYDQLVEPLAYNVLDAAVNLGPAAATSLLTVPRLALPAEAEAYLWARVARYSDITVNNLRKVRGLQGAALIEAERGQLAKLHGWLRRVLQVRQESVLA